MSFTIKIIFFFLGCCFAGLLNLQQKKSGVDLRALLNKLRRILDGFELESQVNGSEKPGVVGDGGDQIMTK